MQRYNAQRLSCQFLPEIGVEIGLFMFCLGMCSRTLQQR